MKVFVLIATVAAVGFAQDSSNCQDGVKSLCKKKSGSPAATACSFTRKSAYNTGDHRNDAGFVSSMLARHNYYRSQPFTGSGGPVTGADIVAVEWDKELEMNAWIWADKLCDKNAGTDNMTIGHDDCRETPSYSYVGQNVAWAAGGSWSAPIDVDGKAVRGWNAENATVSSASSLTNSFPGAYVNGKAIGHYTQVMWAKSYRIGCAYVTSKSPKYQVQGWIVCNYGVGGNYLNQKVFTAGKLGSQCMAGSTAGGTNGLCKVNDVAKFRSTVGVTNAS